MKVSGWYSRPNDETGAGYGIRVRKADRDAYFERRWKRVTVDVGGEATELRLSERFWTTCPELRSKEIGRWMLGRGLAPWPKGAPPRLELTPVGPGRLRLTEA